MAVAACFRARAEIKQDTLRDATIHEQVNHQNGRDTHIRQIRIFGPRETPHLVCGALQEMSPEFSMYSTVR